jgi:hypothetical protein
MTFMSVDHPVPDLVEILAAGERPAAEWADVRLHPRRESGRAEIHAGDDQGAAHSPADAGDAG